MSSAQDTAALVVLLRLGRRPPYAYSAALEEAGSAGAVLRDELRGAGAGAQLTILPDEPDPELELERAEAEIAAWKRCGYRLVSVLDRGYPANLRRVHDRPPLLFVSGELTDADSRSVAVIGSRHASDAGRAAAAGVAEHLAGARYSVVSGLAAGIDTAAHEAALAAGGRTTAVIGTGLAHSYPAQNAGLQRRIAAEGAVVSQFWPDQPPKRENFPLRNAVMSGLALGTVVVEASARSGARVQARRALAHGRPVFLMPAVVAQPWAQELATRPGVHVVDSPEEITTTIERLNATDALVE